MDSYALYAREGFPPMRKPGAKAMWSGDGGSVTLGHVYMTDRLVEATAQQPSAEIARVIYPSLAAAPSRHLGRTQARRFQELAIASVVQELRRVSPARPDRRVFLFAMNNDQARHLYAHFEVLETAEIEFITPFFDPDFASLVASLPIKPFLWHAIYNRILARFHPRSAAFYWQEYPGHVPSPHPRPEGALVQWSKEWDRGSEACSARIQIADEILADRDAMSSGLLNPWILRLTKLSDRLGLSRYSYEVDFARRIAALHHPDT
jgi:asparagine synthase (glutamine-hydrolysing)